MKKTFRRNQIVVSALAIMIAVAGYLTYAGKDGAGVESDLYPTNEVAQNGDTYIAGNLEVADKDLLKESQNVSEAASDASDTVQEEAASAGAEQQSAETAGETAAQMTKTEQAAASTASSQASEQTAPSADQSTSPESTQELSDIGSLDQDIADTLKNPGEAVLTSGLTVADFMAQVKLNREQVRGMNKEALLKVMDNESVPTEEKQDAVDSMVKLTEISDKENAAESLLRAKGFEETIVSIVDGEADVVICKDTLTDAERAQVEDIIKRKTDIGVEKIVITLMETN